MGWAPTGTQKSDYTWDGVKSHSTGKLSDSLGANTNKDKKPPVAIAPPNTDDAEISAEMNSDMIRKRKGRGSTILSGADGDMPSSSNIATKILLGM